MRVGGKDVLTSEDIRKMVERVKGVRDKALIISLWESGTRIRCEFLQMRIRDVTFDQYGCLAVVGDPQESKTGQRTIRLIDSSDFIHAWLQDHPNPRPDNYLWVSNRDKEWFDPATNRKEIIKSCRNGVVKERGQEIDLARIAYLLQLDQSGMNQYRAPACFYYYASAAFGIEFGLFDLPCEFGKVLDRLSEFYGNQFVTHHYQFPARVLRSEQFFRAKNFHASSFLLLSYTSPRPLISRAQFSFSFSSSFFQKTCDL